jgi:hypothetical protein
MVRRILEFGFVLIVAVATTASAAPVHVGGMQSGTGVFDPVTGQFFEEMRNDITAAFPGSTFTSVVELSGDLSGYDLIVASGFNDPGLTSAEQTNLGNFVLGGGHYFYVGEGVSTPNNTSFVAPVGMTMAPDPTTGDPNVFAPWTNPTHPFLNGPFGQATTPPGSVSGSGAAMVTTLGLALELARWNPSTGNGGIAVAAITRDALAPGSGFVVVGTDVNMISPSRWGTELGIPLMNALYLSQQPIPEPSSAAGLALLAMIKIARFGSRRSHR